MPGRTGTRGDVATSLPARKCFDTDAWWWQERCEPISTAPLQRGPCLRNSPLPVPVGRCHGTTAS